MIGHQTGFIDLVNVGLGFDAVVVVAEIFAVTVGNEQVFQAVIIKIENAITCKNLDVVTYQTIYVGLFGFIRYCEQKVDEEE